MKPRSDFFSSGIAFIAGSVLVLIPYTILVVTFNYPEVLRNPAGEILTRFHAAGSPLIFTWLAFALLGFPLLFGYHRLGQFLQKDHPFAGFATFIGLAGGMVQIIGLLRWVFVVPVLASAYAGTDSQVVKTSLESSFMLIHQFGGVLLGEHLGQLFTIFWLISFSVILFQAGLIGKAFAGFGLLSGIIYLLAQAELLATVIPGFPVWEPAGFIGSTLWLIWMIVLGIRMMGKGLGVRHKG